MKSTKKKKPTFKHTAYGLIADIRENEGLTESVDHFTKHFLKDFPKEKDPHFFHHTYTYRLRTLLGHLRFYSILYSYLDISSSSAERLRSDCQTLGDPDCNRNKKELSKNLGHFLPRLRKTDVEVLERIRNLANVECIRLAEAMRTLESGCNLSSVVMAVSAVEHRLHKLIAKSKPGLYEKEFGKATLGTLIELFRKDSRFKDKKYNSLKKLLPEKHKPLMEMLNIYRIFSAHPKDELISSQTAKAILSLSFLLLMDDSLKLK